MISLNNYPALRKFVTRLKRIYLGRQYRHMAKISRHLKIHNTQNPSIFWKKQLLCKTISFNEVHNTLLGETAFIIASGPSVNQLDIGPLQNKYTFGVNGSILKFIEAGISPSFYVISDEEFIYNRPELLQLVLKHDQCHCFFTPQAISAICEIDPNLLKINQKITIFHNHFKNYDQRALEYCDIAKMALNDAEIITKDGRIGFSLNPNKGVFTAHTIPYFALQLAFGLGFRRVNLVGMDLGSSNGNTRFYEQGDAAMPSYLERDYTNTILPSFKIVGELCKKDVFQVFNISPNSRLPESIIAKKSFKEAVSSD